MDKYALVDLPKAEEDEVALIGQYIKTLIPECRFVFVVQTIDPISPTGVLARIAVSQGLPKELVRRMLVETLEAMDQCDTGFKNIQPPQRS
jgi:hypothetical protein